MITAEIKVNGVLIGHLAVTNITEDPQTSWTHDYHCQFTDVDSGDSHEFDVTHKPKDGAVKLMAICFERIPNVN